VTGLGALPFSSRKNPQFINTISRSPSSLWRTTGVTWRGKIVFTGSKATVRLWDTRKKRPTWSRFGVSEYRLQIGCLPCAYTIVPAAHLIGASMLGKVGEWGSFPVLG